jgi:hypothetical protein
MGQSMEILIAGAATALTLFAGPVQAQDTVVTIGTGGAICRLVNRGRRLGLHHQRHPRRRA